MVCKDCMYWYYALFLSPHEEPEERTKRWRVFIMEVCTQCRGMCSKGWSSLGV